MRVGIFVFRFRWLLALIGLNIAGIRGAFVGFLLGYALDVLYVKPRERKQNTYRRQQQQYSRTYSGDTYGGYSRTEPYTPYVNVALQDAYRTLGISPQATDEEVRQAYRRMALKYHPDKAASQGEEARRRAEKIFQQIGEAKDRIFKARGMK